MKVQMRIENVGDEWKDLTNGTVELSQEDCDGIVDVMRKTWHDHEFRVVETN